MLWREEEVKAVMKKICAEELEEYSDIFGCT